MLTKEQKAFAIKELETKFQLLMKCDGYEILLKFGLSKNKLVVRVFVDGDAKPIWSKEHDKHPEAKYLAPHFINLYKPKDKAMVIKELGKRRAYKHYPDLDKKVEYRLPYFANATKAINHLMKVSESIELLTEMAA